MATVNPYLVFNGNCEEAFNHYKNAFGGEFRQITRFSDMPPIPGQQIPEDLKNKIMHMSFPLSEETILMGSDNNPSMGEVKTGQNLSISVSTANKAEADRVFNALAEGGQVTMPLSDTFWGSYFGMLVDPYGFIWLVEWAKK